jgi:hypothetical protein
MRLELNLLNFMHSENIWTKEERNNRRVGKTAQ